MHLLWGPLSFFCWGLMPLYWAYFTHIKALDLVCLRIISCTFLLFFYHVYRGRVGLIKDYLSHNKTLLHLTLSSISMALNWVIFIMAIKDHRVMEVSIGFYLSPLISIFLGRVFYGDIFGLGAKLGVLCASIAIGASIYMYGSFPVYGIGLALTFVFYSFIRKTLNLKTSTSLWVEASVLFIPACWHLGRSYGSEIVMQSFFRWEYLFIGVVPIIPFVFFNRALQKISFSMMGVFQYISPTCQFFLGVYYFNEEWNSQKFFTFLLIWLGIFLFLGEKLLFFNRFHRQEISQ